MKRNLTLRSSLLSILALLTVGCQHSVNDVLLAEDLDFNANVLPHLVPEPSLSPDTKNALRAAVDDHVALVKEVADAQH